MTKLDKKTLYRIPWSLYDSPVGWVEITDKCDMYCKGCYRDYIQTQEGHKCLEDIEKEVSFMVKERNVSEIHLAGGEPLLHPDIIEIVKLISRQKLGVKIFTNGKDLNRDFMQQLASAGLNSFAIHIDSGQTRDDKWDNKSEVELNYLRQHYLNMGANVKNLTLSFVLMVNKKNFIDIPKIIQWALDNKGKVKTLIFIAVRCCRAVENEIKPGLLSTNSDDNVTSIEIYDVIKNHYPSYGVAAFFGGTINPKSFKWLHSVSFCSNKSLLGSISSVSMEIFQVLRHFIYGGYKANDNNIGVMTRYLSNLFCVIFDKNIRKVLFDFVKKPKLLLDSFYLLNILILQGHDFSVSGEMDMCDGCPDMTYFQGRLVNSCRLDEFRKYGRFITDLGEEN